LGHRPASNGERHGRYRLDRARCRRRSHRRNLTGKKTGLLLATAIGIAGALLGGFQARELFGVKTLDTFFNLSTWVTAIVGAVVLFLLFGAVRGRGRRSRRA
jgi:uncharacterized membrane protein YeaQ/YmgE (transglycosylase-associated protein family)